MHAAPALPAVPLLARGRPPLAWPGAPELRPDLVAGLGDRGVVVVRAPAGYGKSAFVRRWLVDGPRGRPVVWLALNGGDADVDHLLDGLEGAAAQVDGTPPPPTASRHGLDRLPALLGWIEDLPIAPAVVLDGLEWLPAGSDAYAVVTALVEYLPPAACLVLVGRRQLPFGTRGLRAEGRLREVGVDDLRLEAGDLGSLLASQGLHLDEARLAEAVRLTNGWPALAWLVAQGWARGPLDRTAVHDVGPATDYLVTEVLDRLPDRLRRCIARLAVVDHIDQVSVDTMLADAGSTWTPERLVAEGLFPPGEDGAHPRHHPLLRRVLLRELQRDHGGTVRWQRAAATMRLAQGRPGWAVPHLVAAGDAGAVRDLVRDAWPDLLADGQVDVLGPWFEAWDPDDEVRLVAARAATTLVGLDEAGYREARAALDAMDPGAETGAGSVAVLRDALDVLANLHLDGSPAAARDAGRRALRHERLPSSMQVMVRYGLALAQLLLDDPAAVQTVEPLLWLSPDDVGPWLRALFRAVAVLGLVDSDPERALLLSAGQLTGDDPALDEREPFRVGLESVARGRALLAAGDEDGAVAALRLAVAAVRANPERVSETLVAELRLRVALAGGTTDRSAGSDVDEAVHLALARWPGDERIAARFARLRRGSDREPGETGEGARDEVELTAREREVLTAIGEGGSLTEVAARLGIGRETVRTHARSLRRKLGVASLADLRARERVT